MKLIGNIIIDHGTYSFQLVLYFIRENLYLFATLTSQTLVKVMFRDKRILNLKHNA